MTEQRRHARIARPLDGSWTGASGGATCRIADVSWGGCFINTLAMPQAGERTIVTLRLGEATVALQGTVVNPVRTVGFAVEFDPLTTNQIEALIPLLGEPPPSLPRRE